MRDRRIAERNVAFDRAREQHVLLQHRRFLPDRLALARVVTEPDPADESDRRSPRSRIAVRLDPVARCRQRGGRHRELSELRGSQRCCNPSQGDDVVGPVGRNQIVDRLLGVVFVQRVLRVQRGLGQRQGRDGVFHQRAAPDAAGRILSPSQVAQADAQLRRVRVVDVTVGEARPENRKHGQACRRRDGRRLFLTCPAALGPPFADRR